MWDYSGDDDVSATEGQYLYAFKLPQLGPGWQLAASPTWSYNNEADDSDDKWTIPLGVGLAKTTKLGDRFWKFQVQYWYYAESPDTFGEDWQDPVHHYAGLPGSVGRDAPLRSGR